VRFLPFLCAKAFAAGCELKPDSPKQGDAIRVTCAADIASARMDRRTILRSIGVVNGLCAD